MKLWKECTISSWHLKRTTKLTISTISTMSHQYYILCGAMSKATRKRKWALINKKNTSLWWFCSSDTNKTNKSNTWLTNRSSKESKTILNCSKEYICSITNQLDIFIKNLLKTTWITCTNYSMRRLRIRIIAKGNIWYNALTTTCASTRDC